MGVLDGINVDVRSDPHKSKLDSKLDSKFAGIQDISVMHLVETEGPDKHFHFRVRKVNESRVQDLLSTLQAHKRTHI